MDFHFDLFGLPFGVVVDDDFQRTKDRHGTGRVLIEVVPDTGFEQAEVHDGVRLGDADTGTEVPDGCGREAAASHAGDGDHARVVPAVDIAVVDKIEAAAFTGDTVVEVETGELDLPRGRLIDFALSADPVIEGSVVLELQGAQRMGDAFTGIFQRVREVVHRVDAPLVALAEMAHVCNAVDDRVSHVHVRRAHVDLRAKDLLPVGELAFGHAVEEVEVLLNGTVPVRAVLAGLGQRAAVLADLVSREVVDKGQALFDEQDGLLVHVVEVVGGVVQVLIVVPEPLDVLGNGVRVLGVFLAGVRVVHPQVADAVIFLRCVEVDVDRLRVADVQVAVGLRREPGLDVVVNACFQVRVNEVVDEVRGRCERVHSFLFHSVHPL